VRHTVMPVLERELGPGVAEAFARTGQQLRWDTELLEEVEQAAYERARLPDGLDLAPIEDGGQALRTRCARRAAIAAGAVPSEITLDHVLAVLALAGTHGEKQVQLPGHVTATADGQVLRFRRPDSPCQSGPAGARGGPE